MNLIIQESILEYKLSYQVGYYLDSYSIPTRFILSLRDMIKCFKELTVSAIRYKINPRIYEDMFK